MSPTLGGAIGGVEKNEYMFESVKFIETQAGNAGGAVYTLGDVILDAVDIQLKNTYSGGDAGGFFFTKSVVSIVQTDRDEFKGFDGPNAFLSGGAIVLINSDMFIKNIYFYNCSCDGTGGKNYYYYN